ncbi:MAG TPA: cysteine dioxygenase family protein [Thermoleophilaceae bacterium]|nr:cysteine dioxygenase family protein [Thermoleophilaceae bacterium]
MPLPPSTPGLAGVHRPRGRDLIRPELRDLALAVASRPELWRHLAHHDPAARFYEELLRDDHVAVWLICWMRDHDTGFHDHDRSSGGVAIASGAVREDRLSLAGPVTRWFRAGQAFDFAASDIHRVLHDGSKPAVTIHAYSPPLSRMGAYETTPTGELQRHSISYEQELRPLGDAAVR